MSEQRRVPDGVALRVVGDVHGDAKGFTYAVETDRFIVQLGDLIDQGPASATALRIMFDLIDAGRGLFLVGNHELKLARVLAGQAVRTDAAVADTLGQLDQSLRARVLAEVARAPAWLRYGNALFVHGGFHTAMLEAPSPVVGLGRPGPVVARALYGEPTGRAQPDGYPERSLAWVDRIPAGLTVYCGHDRRSGDGRPLMRHGSAGGTAVFLDTGAGKGGHLSWIDLDPVTGPAPE
ncbi:MAG TPA: metallophosphoesterase [Acetobacteraceae bacterium]|nr:metallophosphoesterase [Acetobacteraceae bacterium]